MRRRRRRGGTIAIVLILVALIGLVGYTTQQRASAYDYTDEGRWIVQSGDTLWTIAGEYSDNRHDIRKVIHIIRTECNDNISAEIYPGQCIYVPLFDCMDWEEWSE